MHGTDVCSSCWPDLSRYLEVLVLLHQRGATIGDSLLELAVKHQSHSIMRDLLDESAIKPGQVELAACFPISSSSSMEDQRARVEPLTIALENCQRTGLREVFPPPSSIDDHQQECKTNDERETRVERIDNHDRLLIEVLLIQERLQSSAQQQPGRTRLFQLQEFSQIIVAKKRFDTCFDLFHCYLDLEEQYNGDPSLNVFITLNCEMLASNHRLPVERFHPMVNLIFQSLNHVNLERSLNNALFMVILATKVTFSCPS
jgi:hypothetical protein